MFEVEMCGTSGVSEVLVLLVRRVAPVDKKVQDPETHCTY
jgi:hypothetical protein